MSLPSTDEPDSLDGSLDDYLSSDSEARQAELQVQLRRLVNKQQEKTHGGDTSLEDDSEAIARQDQTILDREWQPPTSAWQRPLPSTQRRATCDAWATCLTEAASSNEKRNKDKSDESHDDIETKATSARASIEREVTDDEPQEHDGERRRHHDPKVKTASELEDGSGLEQRRSFSPEKDVEYKRSESPCKIISTRPSREVTPASEANAKQEQESDRGSENYIRFAVRAEVQQRTAPFEVAINLVRCGAERLSKSKQSLLRRFVMLLLITTCFRLLVQPPISPPIPDLIKVAALARSFEPLIFYSEHTVRQITDLQETGVAVWDLGESVRAANMTSAPIIVHELDSLSDSLKGLGLELTRFFANVDGDIDGILIVMDWTKRELCALGDRAHDMSTTSGLQAPSIYLSRAFANTHSLLSTMGLLEDATTHTPTSLGATITSLFGSTSAQQTHAALQRTFDELLGVLEESIATELTHASALFALFETIDRQFINLHRSVVRETDTQERLEHEFLSSLWTRLMGPDSVRLRKYGKNKDLLASVRARTMENKALLTAHNGRLLGLKENLEVLRRRLLSPQVNRGNGANFLTSSTARHSGTFRDVKSTSSKSNPQDHLSYSDASTKASTGTGPESRSLQTDTHVDSDRHDSKHHHSEHNDNKSKKAEQAKDHDQDQDHSTTVSSRISQLRAFQGQSRRDSTSSFHSTLNEHIASLDSTYQHLRRVREKQKQRMMSLLYGVGDTARTRLIDVNRHGMGSSMDMEMGISS